MATPTAIAGMIDDKVRRPETRPTGNEASRASAPGAWRRGMVLVAMLVLVSVAVGLLLEELYLSRRNPGQAPVVKSSIDESAPAPQPVWPRGKDPETTAHPGASEMQPWESTSQNTPNPGPGHTPAWKVNVPRPAAIPPPAPVAMPPNPQTHRPPAQNPGGVNGDRPPRPIPGLE